MSTGWAWLEKITKGLIISFSINNRSIKLKQINMSNVYEMITFESIPVNNESMNHSRESFWSINRSIDEQLNKFDDANIFWLVLWLMSSSMFLDSFFFLSFVSDCLRSYSSSHIGQLNYFISFVLVWLTSVLFIISSEQYQTEVQTWFWIFRYQH